MHLLLLFIVLFSLIALKVPIAVSLGLSSLLIMLLRGLNPMNFVMQTYRALDSFTLLAIPFFLMVGLIVSKTSMAQRLLDVADLLVGRVKGSLGHVNVVVSMLFGGISGSATADTSSIGAILIPMMKAKGYSAPYSAAITAASSTIGLIIPPSIVMIIYGAFIHTSIGALFLTGIVPGVAIGFGMMLINALHVRRNGIDARREYHRAEKDGASIPPTSVRFSRSFDSLRTGIKILKRGLPVLGVPLIIILGITGGVFTATEAGAIAFFYLLVLVAVFYREVRWKEFFDIAKGSVLLYSLPLLTVAAAGAFGWVLSLLGASRLVTEIINNYTSSQNTFMITVIIIFTILGTFLDAVPAIVIFAPLFSPTAIVLGIHPVHLGVVITLVLAVGLVTPPYGLSLLIASKLAGVTVWETTKSILPFWLVSYVVIIIFAISEQYALALPRLIAPDLF